MHKNNKVVTALSSLCIFLSGCAITNSPPAEESLYSDMTIEILSSDFEESTEFYTGSETEEVKNERDDTSETGSTALIIPPYNCEAYAIINGNTPFFTDEEMTGTSFEGYSDLDSLGRCGAAFACVGQDIMPTEERGEIGMVKPTGWHTVKYDFVDGKYLYNRCHLIGYQLTGENANECNLITGTRYLNVTGMLPFENEIADYVHNTDNHVLYRVTPIFEGDNLLADGVLMEAKSVEDDGAGICFNVFCYNVQPGVGIDYATGDNWLDETTTEVETEESSEGTKYILNTNSKKFHDPDCDSVNDIKSQNKKEYNGAREELISDGYSPCSRCNP